jgi:hypothetical protein
MLETKARYSAIIYLYNYMIHTHIYMFFIKSSTRGASSWSFVSVLKFKNIFISWRVEWIKTRTNNLLSSGFTNKYFTRILIYCPDSKGGIYTKIISFIDSVVDIP